MVVSTSSSYASTQEIGTAVASGGPPISESGKGAKSRTGAKDNIKAWRGVVCLLEVLPISESRRCSCYGKHTLGILRGRMRMAMKEDDNVNARDS